MGYTAVKDAHILPKAYLRNFAGPDGNAIGVRFPDDSQKRLTLSIAKVATRKHFYRRERPDGTKIDDVEWSLSQLEGAAAPVLAAVGDLWPLETEDKGKLAQFFAMQLLRTPQWMEWHGDFTTKFFEERREQGLPGNERSDADAGEAEAEEHLRSSTPRLLRMLSLSRKAAMILGSMHWTLIEFATPLLATSDQPVYLWSRSVHSSGPRASDFGVGLLETLEVRVPISPHQALFMTWHDAPDSDERRIEGNEHQAAALNAFTIANCDRQWFHLPGTSPPVARGRLGPLSPQLLPGYSAERAGGSQRRARTAQIIESRKDEDLNADDLEVVVVS